MFQIMLRLLEGTESIVQPGWAGDTSDEAEAAGPEAMQIHQYLDKFPMPWLHASLFHRLASSAPHR